MKRLPILTLASLATNVVLLCAVLAFRPSGRAASQPGASRPLATRPSVSTAARTTESAGHRPVHGNTWDELNRGDLPTVAARLAAAGVPPRTLRLIITTLLDGIYGQRRATLLHEDDAAPYWRPGSRNQPDPEVTRSILALKAEHSRLLRQIFGPEIEVPDDEVQLALYRQQHGDLPAEKMAKLEDLAREMANQWLRDRQPNTPPSAAEMDRSQAQMRAYQAEIDRLLTPYEREQKALRSSSTASFLRRELNLACTNITEDEYRLAFQLYAPLIQQWDLVPATQNAAQWTAWREQAAQLKRQLKDQLSPERYAEIEFASDAHNREVLDLTSRLDLPLAAAKSVSTVRQQITAQAETVRSDATLTGEQRSAQLAGLAREAENRIRESLGRRGLEGYRRSSASTWLQELNRK